MINEGIDILTLICVFTMINEGIDILTLIGVFSMINEGIDIFDIFEESHLEIRGNPP